MYELLSFQELEMAIWAAAQKDWLYSSSKSA